MLLEEERALLVEREDEDEELEELDVVTAAACTPLTLSAYFALVFLPNPYDNESLLSLRSLNVAQAT